MNKTNRKKNEIEAEKSKFREFMRLVSKCVKWIFNKKKQNRKKE